MATEQVKGIKNIGLLDSGANDATVLYSSSLPRCEREPEGIPST
jgi:hypothetical protein